MAQTFDLLHEKVQKFIYNARWENFRPIQDQSISTLITSKKNLLICAPTASGKTEAAFLPIVSMIADDYAGSFRAIYVSPLKALINDQFRRIEEMCVGIGIPITKWHGDVSKSHKDRSVANPAGILLITPESLEAMLVHRADRARSLFSKLDWVVIDEIHSFVGAERGAQLRSILARLEEEVGRTPVRIGLSATIGNIKAVADWMSEGKTAVVEDSDWNDSGIEGIIKGFERPSPIETESPVDESDENEEPSLLVRALCHSFSSGKNLIFGNSKAKLEKISHAVANVAQQEHVSAKFVIHHGSLSKFSRESAEAEIKNSEQAVSVFCTSTLEMGIDIGKIEKIGLIDPPWAVSSFAQRVGRSGRRAGANKKFEFMIEQLEMRSDMRISDSLRETLIKSIAVTLLYLEGFKEPLRIDRLHASTLAHQILAFASQKTGATLAQIQKVIVENGFRSAIDESSLRVLLDQLVTKRFLYLESSGRFLPGGIGEKLVEHFEFYSVFLSSEQWSVVCDGTLIGEVPVTSPYVVDDRILLGSRVWTIIDVNETGKRLSVRQARAGRAPTFGGSFGITDAKIHQKMKQIYESEESYAFLDEMAAKHLVEARQSYKSLLSNAADSSRIGIFEGTVIQNTIKIAFQRAGVAVSLSEVCLEIEKRGVDWKQALRHELTRQTSELSLAQEVSRDFKIREKYDGVLPEEMLNQTYAQTMLNLAGARAWLASVSSGTTES
jgi:ATP-dependent Lhr-like helicase